MTSLISGPHVPGSAHFAGRAMDLGIPDVSTGVQMAARAIRSGRFSRIGSERAIVSNPQLQALAQASGVTLFLDEGTGPHLHLEVGQ